MALLYYIVGQYVQGALVNSTWTANHIRTLWRAKNTTRIVYPPCETATLQEFALARPKSNYLLSVAQFRPEKQHLLQLEAYALARQCAQEGHPVEGLAEREWTIDSARVLASKLVMVGGCRNEADRARLAALRQKAEELVRA